jgi:hypothetical protein
MVYPLAKPFAKETADFSNCVLLLGQFLMFPSSSVYR